MATDDRYILQAREELGLPLGMLSNDDLHKLLARAQALKTEATQPFDQMMAALFGGE